jgi:hypothetical protein
MTPELTAQRLVADLALSSTSTVLEPSFGEGSFLVPLIGRLMTLHRGSERSRFEVVMQQNLYGVELDPKLYECAVRNIEKRWGGLPRGHHLECGDYFAAEFGSSRGFDVIVGNPPFGGTFDPTLEDALDKRFGAHRGHKLKKETYSFFVAKAIEELAPGGHLRFICSDTFLTIRTMRGLRELLMGSGNVQVTDLAGGFESTSQPMVVLDLHDGAPAPRIAVRGTTLTRGAMESTPNLSWGLSAELAPCFDGSFVGDFVVATGGMTTGRNELFVRSIEAGATVYEPYEFEFFERPVTLDGERARARLNKLSHRLQARICDEEKRGCTRRAVRPVTLAEPRQIQLPHPDYAPYNRASANRVFAAPTHVVYWRDDGDAVRTFKKDGPWYLHGVGGAPFFGREGLTWQLVAARINARYLPPGFILDSGAPCAFLREGVDEQELYVILAWLQTGLATTLLKQVINHTRNIQGKDIERLPYPHWTSASDRKRAANLVRREITQLLEGAPPSDGLQVDLDSLFVMRAQVRNVA